MFGNDKYVVALLHCNGVLHSNTYTDSAFNGGHTWTAFGAHSPPHVWIEWTSETLCPNINSALPSSVKFGQSLYFDELTGTPGYSHLETAYSTDFNFGTGNFTWDMWVRFNNGPGAGTLPPGNAGGLRGFFCVGWQTNLNNRVVFCMFNRGGGNPQYSFFFIATSGGVAKANYNTPYISLSFPTAWYHLAAVRSGTSFYIFVNGVSQSLTETTAIGSNSLDLATSEKSTVGYAGPYAPFPPQLPNDMDGWMDEIRISKGIARWTSNFTVPSQPYSDVSHFFPPHRNV